MNQTPPDRPYCPFGWDRCPVNRRIEDLRDLLDEREKAAGQREELRERQVTLAREQIHHRLNTMNEIREQLTDQAARLATRESLEAIETKVLLLIEKHVEADAVSHRIFSIDLGRITKTQDRMIGYVLGAAVAGSVFSTVLSQIVRAMVGP